MLKRPEVIAVHELHHHLRFAPGGAGWDRALSTTSPTAWPLALSTTCDPAVTWSLTAPVTGRLDLLGQVQQPALRVELDLVRQPHRGGHLERQPQAIQQFGVGQSRQLHRLGLAGQSVATVLAGRVDEGVPAPTRRDSSTVTRRPARASRQAVVSPAMPAPTTTTSLSDGATPDG